MSRLLEIRDVDRRFYREKLESFLPDRIIDAHTHVWLKDFRKAPPTGRAVTWPLRVAEQGPVEELIETYRLLFPGKSVRPQMFSFIESHRGRLRCGQCLRQSCRSRAWLPGPGFRLTAMVGREV